MLDHGCHLSLVSDIATDPNSLMTGGDELFGRGTSGIFVDICQHDRSSRFRESSGRDKPQSGACASNQRNLIFE